MIYNIEIAIKFMKKLVLVILWGTFFTFAVELIAPIYAIFVKDISGDILSVGFAYAIYSIVLATLQPFMGKLADKYGRIKLSILANLINSFGLFGYIFITNIFHIYFLQFLLGVGSSIAAPSQQSMIADVTSKKKRGEEFGYLNMFLGYSGAIAAILAGVIAQFIGFQVVFLIGGFVALFSTIFLIMLRNRS
jgi:MFS family permease